MAEALLKQLRPVLKLIKEKAATVEQRRFFATELKTLPTFHEVAATLFFANFVGECFADFEDLQDASVDAVLDMCEDEDEATRILGINGLGKTAKADMRWVRGNAGVLLQLLECPDKELVEVKRILADLLRLNPVQVLGVMADDCKGSEEDTGASRRNILDYLYKDCFEFRRIQLEFNGIPLAETIFAKGFMDVLKTAAPAEALMVFEMLHNLPSISGPSAKPEVTAAFAKALASSKRPEVSGDRIKFVHLFGRLAGKVAVDPLVALQFFDNHGKTVVSAILEKRDDAALTLVKKLQEWAAQVVKQWEQGGQPEAEGKTVRYSVGSMIDQLSSWENSTKSDEYLEKYCPQIEHILLPIYHLVRFRDLRDSAIDYPKDFVTLGARASSRKDANTRRSADDRCLANVALMAGILGKHDAPFADITPSWLPEPQPSARKSTVPTGPLRSIPAGPTAPAPKAPTGPRGTPPITRPAPATTPPNAPAGPRNGNPTNGGRSGASMSINGRATYGNGRADAIDLTADDRPSSSRGRELLTSSTSSTQTSAPGRGKELFSSLPQKPMPSEPVEESMEPIPTPPSSTSRPLGLADRIQGRVPSATKRQRDEPSSSSNDAPIPPSSSSTNLRSRIGTRSDEPDLKRTRSDDAVPTRAGLSSRMSGPSGLAILNRAQPGPGRQSPPSAVSSFVSGMNRIRPPGSIPPSYPSPPASMPRANSGTSTLPLPRITSLSIRGTHAPVDEEPVVRRGRGFTKGVNGEDVSMADASGTEAPAAPAVRAPTGPAAEARPARPADTKPPRSLWSVTQQGIMKAQPIIKRQVERRPTATANGSLRDISAGVGGGMSAEALRFNSRLGAVTSGR